MLIQCKLKNDFSKMKTVNFCELYVLVSVNSIQTISTYFFFKESLLRRVGHSFYRPYTCYTLHYSEVFLFLKDIICIIIFRIARRDHYE